MIPAIPQQKLLEDYVFQSIEEESEEKVVEKYSREGKEYKLVIEKKEGRWCKSEKGGEGRQDECITMSNMW